MGEMAALSGLPNAFILGAGAASSRVAGVNCEVCVYTVHKHMHTQYIVYVFMYMCTEYVHVYVLMYMCTECVLSVYMYMCMYIVYVFMYMCTEYVHCICVYVHVY